jgi:pimeloyl-ACP methyl ester carboxylesterase
MKKHLILLHGALGCAAQLEPLKYELKADWQVHSFNFLGHGGQPIPSSLLITHLVDQLAEYIRTQIPDKNPITIFGYSMGGYAALMLASRNIFPIQQIITLGTKLFWSPEVATREIGMLNPNVIEQKLPAFAKELEERHAPGDWKLLLAQTAGLMTDLGAHHYLNDEVLGGITVPCKLMLGDKDKMVSLNETVHAFNQIQQRALCVLPSTPHPIEKVDVKRLVFELTH